MVMPPLLSLEAGRQAVACPGPAGPGPLPRWSSWGWCLHYLWSEQKLPSAHILSPPRHTTDILQRSLSVWRYFTLIEREEVGPVELSMVQNDGKVKWQPTHLSRLEAQSNGRSELFLCGDFVCLMHLKTMLWGLLAQLRCLHTFQDKQAIRFLCILGAGRMRDLG